MTAKREARLEAQERLGGVAYHEPTNPDAEFQLPANRTGESAEARLAGVAYYRAPANPDAEFVLPASRGDGFNGHEVDSTNQKPVNVNVPDNIPSFQSTANLDDSFGSTPKVNYSTDSHFRKDDENNDNYVYCSTNFNYPNNSKSDQKSQESSSNNINKINIGNDFNYNNGNHNGINDDFIDMNLRPVGSEVAKEEEIYYDDSVYSGYSDASLARSHHAKADVNLSDDTSETSPYEAPKTTSYEAPKTTVNETPETTPYEAPKTTSYDAPKATLYEAPKTTPYEAPKTTPYDLSKTTSYETPKTTSYADSVKLPNSSKGSTTNILNVAGISAANGFSVGDVRNSDRTVTNLSYNSNGRGSEAESKNISANFMHVPSKPWRIGGSDTVDSPSGSDTNRYNNEGKIKTVNSYTAEASESPNSKPIDLRKSVSVESTNFGSTAGSPEKPLRLSTIQGAKRRAPLPTATPRVSLSRDNSQTSGKYDSSVEYENLPPEMTSPNSSFSGQYKLPEKVKSNGNEIYSEGLSKSEEDSNDNEDAGIPLMDPQPDLIPESVRRRPPKPVKPANLSAHFKQQRSFEKQSPDVSDIKKFVPSNGGSGPSNLSFEHNQKDYHSGENSDASSMKTDSRQSSIVDKKSRPRPIPPPRTCSIKSDDDDSLTTLTDQSINDNSDLLKEIIVQQSSQQLTVVSTSEGLQSNNNGNIPEHLRVNNNLHISKHSVNLNNDNIQITDNNLMLNSDNMRLNDENMGANNSGRNGIDIHVTVTVKPLAPGTLADLKQQRAKSRGLSVSPDKASSPSIAASSSIIPALESHTAVVQKGNSPGEPSVMFSKRESFEQNLSHQMRAAGHDNRAYDAETTSYDYKGQNTPAQLDISGSQGGVVDQYNLNLGVQVNKSPSHNTPNCPSSPATLRRKFSQPSAHTTYPEVVKKPCCVIL